MTVLTVPNLLTIARIALIPIFAAAVIYENYSFALYLFLFAALTDMLDGLAARLIKQKTPLGTFLDPLADKFIIATSFILFSYLGWLPKWLTITVISRDIIVVIGWVLLYMLAHVREIEPSRLGKLSIAVEFVLLCYVLFDINYGLPAQFKSALVWLAAALATASGLHYIFRGLKVADER